MGTDGAQGAKLIHNAGGIMIAQDKQSSVVFGMPKAAIELNAIDYILSLNEIPQFLFQKLDQLSCISRTHDNP
jgi:two-component system chemotaxis response regulator CheB